MSSCCACATCQCLCHHHLTPNDYHRMTQEALLGERLARVAQRWHVTPTQVRLIIAHVCSEANPERYQQQSRWGGKVLDKLRLYATDYGFEAAPKYAAWRREREEGTHGRCKAMGD
jgi:Na+-translocating ferredoxin:NAD+ oxidoreductase RnfC subunit